MSKQILVDMDELLSSIQAIVAAEFQKQLAEPKRIKSTLDFEEARKYLGYSKSHLYKLTSAGIVDIIIWWLTFLTDKSILANAIRHKNISLIS